MGAPGPKLRLVSDPPQQAAQAPLRLEDVFRQYAPYVAAIALRLLGRTDEVEELVQDVFLEAVRGLRRIRDPGAVKGWLATVTVRKARKRLRRRRMRAAMGLDRPVNADAGASPNLSPEQRALLRRVYAVLDELPADQRLAWTLRYIEGERLESVARLCGCSLATAKRRIAAAHSFVQEMVNDG